MSNKTIPESQTQFLRFATPEKPFSFTSGMVMDDLTLAYETYGKLNEDKSNAILVFHALSGSQHAAGVCRHVAHTGDRWTEDCQQGWWSHFIGPGKALDTQKFFVICANYLGGCYGSSGPASLNPKTGRPYGPEFPQVSTADVVRSQALLVDHFGIDKLHAVMGASVGGLLTLNFATLFPERVRLVVSIASGQRTTVLSRLGVFEQVMAIENDPHFKGGNYYDSDPPAYGLALARMISHKTFVHLDAIERRARGDVIQRDDQLSWYRVGHNVESYMLHQGKKFVKRFDANTYLRICDMWLRFDPLKDAGVEDHGALFAISRRAGHHWLVFSIDSDFCFYPEEQAELVRWLEQADVSSMHITVHSDKGHDSFLLEPELYTPHLSYTLRRGVQLNDAWDHDATSPGI
ncbi:homoserine O-acetyltransferase [Verrucomicrobium sp. BvORR106]|uniref:homoserine O-acetyltransferase MetX n=1 Tax=Verrucomicrobium sp. BvORR106 TaxID=1403819 RepID=UPI00056E61EC|nr:homoserine O-acetyltransferase [Verrucomicrobium sp. BvORR106]